MNVTSISEKIIFFAINVLITRYLTKEQFGEYATALGFATFFSLFSSLGVIPSLVRAISLDPENEGKYFGNVIIIKTILSVITYMAMVITLLCVRKYSQNTVNLILILGLVRIGNEFMSTFFSFYNANQKFLLSCVYIFFFDLFFLASTVLVIVYRGGYYDFSIWRLIVVIVFIFLLGLHTSRDYRISFAPSMIKSFIVDTIPFGISTVFENIIQHINIIILTLFKGETAGGIFSNGYIFIVSLMFIPFNFDKVIIPYLYRKFKHEKERGVQDIFDISTRMLGILSFFVVMIAFNFGKNIIPMIFSDKYLHSIDIFRIASFCLIFQFTTAGPIITSLDCQKARTNVNIITAFINIASCFVLSYFFDAKGIAYAMIITYASMWFMYIGYLAARHKVSLLRTITSLAKLVFIFFACSALHMLGSSFTGGWLWLAEMSFVSLFFIVLVFFIVLEKSDIEIIRSFFNKQAQKKLS